MVQDVRVLSARRSFEFQADEIRLSMLTVSGVIDGIRRTFAFQTAELGTPRETFGWVIPTMPPGLVFTYGAFKTDEEKIIPLEFLHIEPRRIVFGVAGPSQTIDHAYQLLMRYLSDLRAPDGAAAVGRLAGIQDFSIVSARLSFRPELLLPPPLRRLVREGLGIPAATDRRAIVPALSVTLEAPNLEYQGPPAVEGAGFHLQLRVQNPPDAKVYFSAGPFTSDKHISLLHDLDRSMAPRKQRSKLVGDKSEQA